MSCGKSLPVAWQHAEGILWIRKPEVVVRPVKSLRVSLPWVNSLPYVRQHSEGILRTRKPEVVQAGTYLPGMSRGWATRKYVSKMSSKRPAWEYRCPREYSCCRCTMDWRHHSQYLILNSVKGYPGGLDGMRTITNWKRNRTSP